MQQTYAFLRLPVVNVPDIDFVNHMDLFAGSGPYLAELPSGDMWFVSVYFEPSSANHEGRGIIEYSTPMPLLYVHPYFDRDLYNEQIKALQSRIDALNAMAETKEAEHRAEVAELRCQLESRPTRNGSCEWVSAPTLVKIVETLCARKSPSIPSSASSPEHPQP